MKYFLLLLLLPITLHGASNYSGSLSKGLGAKPTSFGGAYTAIADNTDAIFWNPAGIQKSATSLFYSKYFNEVDYFWIRTTFSNFGIGFLSMSVNDIIHTNTNAEIIGTFSYKDEVLFISHKYQDFGFNLKLLHQKALHEYFGLSSDFSYLHAFDNLKLGIMIQNLIKSNIGTDILTTKYNFGMAYEFESILISADINFSKHLEWAIGTQITIIESLKLISGLNTQQWNLGFEINLESIKINYNFFPHELDNVSELDLHISF